MILLKLHSVALHYTRNNRHLINICGRLQWIYILTCYTKLLQLELYTGSLHLTTVHSTTSHMCTLTGLQSQGHTDLLQILSSSLHVDRVLQNAASARRSLGHSYQHRSVPAQWPGGFCSASWWFFLLLIWEKKLFQSRLVSLGWLYSKC